MKMDEMAVGNVVFNELCEDGTIRPIIISALQVTGVGVLDGSFDGTPFGLPADHFEFSIAEVTRGAVITCAEGRSIRVYAPVDFVMKAVAAATALHLCWVETLHIHPLDFKQTGVNYSPDLSG